MSLPPRAYLVLALVVSMIAAAVALAFAGWQSSTIIGLLTAIAAILAPMLPAVIKTHDIVNSQRTAMQVLLQDKDDALQERGTRIPHDRSLPPRHGER